MSDHEIDIGDVYFQRDPFAAPVEQPSEASVGTDRGKNKNFFKMPNFMKKKQPDAAGTDAAATEMDLEQIYSTNRHSGRDGNSSEVTAKTEVSRKSETTSRTSQLVTHASSEIDFQDAYEIKPHDVHEVRQFSSNPVRRQTISAKPAVKANPLIKPNQRRQSSIGPPGSRELISHASSEIEFQDAYEAKPHDVHEVRHFVANPAMVGRRTPPRSISPPPNKVSPPRQPIQRRGSSRGPIAPPITFVQQATQKQENQKRMLDSGNVTPPTKVTPPRSTKSSPSSNKSTPTRSAAQGANADPVKRAPQPLSFSSISSGNFSNDHDAPRRSERNVSTPKFEIEEKTTNSLKSFMFPKKPSSTEMDQIVTTAATTRTKPSEENKAPPKPKSRIEAFWSMFRSSKKNSSKEIKRSESAALEKMKTVSSPEKQMVVQVDKPNIRNQAKPNAENPHSPLLTNLKANMEMQGYAETIQFADKAAFENSLLVSREAIGVARENYKKSNRINVKRNGTDLAMLLEALGDIYKAMGDFDNAISCLKEAVETRSAVKSEAQHVAAAYNDLGLIYCESKLYPEAYDCFDFAFSLLSDYHEEGKHPDVAATLGNLSICMRGMSQHSEAVNIGVQSKKLMEELCGKDDINTLQQEAILAMNLLPAGDAQLSARMLGQLIQVLESQRGYSKGHPYLALLRFELARAKNRTPVLDSTPAE